MKLIAALLLACIALFASTSATTKNSAGVLITTFKDNSVPTSPTAVTTVEYRVDSINLINNNGSAVTCTIKDQDPAGASSLIPDAISIPANTQFVWDLKQVVANGGIIWNCNTSLVVGRIIVRR